MSLVPHIVPIEMSPEKQRDIVLTNITKMLQERKLINPSNLDAYVANVISSLKDDNTCDIIVSENITYKIILLVDQKISTVTKTSLIGDYLYKNPDLHKIIIVGEITPRARQTVQTNFPLIEIFLKKEMMFNIVEHMYVPKHILLSNDETGQILKEYGMQKREMPRILLSDPISRYYHAKIGQIFRIIRPSETSGYSVYYRIVSRDIMTKKK